jgi:hypothetical protein
MKAVSAIFNIVFVPPDYSWIRKARKAESLSLSSTDWKSKDNPVKCRNDYFRNSRSGDRNRTCSLAHSAF